VEVEPGQAIREFSISWFPDLHPRAISLRGVQIEIVDQQTADVSVVEFDITTILQTALGFSFFAAEAKSPNVTAGNLTAVKEAFFGFIFEFFAVFEFTEVNGIPGFQNGTGDIITGAYDLSSAFLPWKDLFIQSSDITGTDGKNYSLFVIACETQDEVFFMEYTVCGTNVEVNGHEVTSSSTKIDLAIQWFTDTHVPGAWTTGPSNPDLVPHAQNAFAMGMGAVAEVVNAGKGSGTPNPSLNFTAGGFVAFLEWDNIVEVTAQNGTVFAGDVYADIIEVEGSESGSNDNGDYAEGWLVRALFFSFQGYRPAQIYWDPTVGAVTPVNSTSSASSDAAIAAPAAALFVAMAALLF